jgi:hypothetical protein
MRRYDMELYEGIEIVKVMKPGSRAIGVMGMYWNYEIHMNEYGDVCWHDGVVVGLDRYFLSTKWLLKQK